MAWLPLLAIAIGVEAPSTREVDELAPDFRAAKLHEVVLRLLEPALAIPTLVMIEHAHLMDEASAALLEALAHRLPSSAWVVIATRRDVASGFTTSDSATLRIELEPLSREAIMELAESTPEAHVIPPHMLELAVDRSAGSPEFLLDLLSAAAGGSATLPDTLETAASARIDALDPGDRELIRRAAVLGLSFRPRQLRHVLPAGSDEPSPEVWQRLSGVFASDSDGHLRFKRPALCEAAYDGLPFRLRRELHAEVGRALEAELGREVDAEPAVLSLHFSRAGDHERAWRYALMGARRAASRFAHAEAAMLYRRAVEAGRGDGVSSDDLAAAWESLGESLARAGEVRAAVSAFTAARRLLADDPIAQARLCFRHGRIAEDHQLTAAVRWMRRGLRTLDPLSTAEARSWRARLIAELGWIRDRQTRLAEAERLCRQALSEGLEFGELRAQARACYTLDLALFKMGRSDEMGYSQRALDIYQELADPDHEGNVWNNLGAFAYWEGRWGDAVDLYRRAAACGERAGNAQFEADTSANIGEIRSDQGRLDEADTHLRRARRVASSVGYREGAAFADMLLGRLAVRSGRAEEGIASLEATGEEMRQMGVGVHAELTDALVAEAEAVGGAPDRALAAAARLLGGVNPHVALLRRASGIALARMGERDRARCELEAAAATARERGEDYEVAAALDALAALGPLDTDQRSELETILARLGIVRLPTVADLQSIAGARPVAGVAGI
jgi:tetratricopeptide (TPR) repeat protein